MFKPVLFSDLRKYNLSTFRADLFAGLTVGVVALPLSMAFAIACGLPPSRGIFTAVIAGFLISAFGGCRLQIGGPTGAFVVIISSIYLKYGDGGLMASTLLAGLFLIIFGLFRMGALIKFIPFPVVTGFTSGIAVVIFSTQLKDIFGLTKLELPSGFVAKLTAIASHFGEVNPQAVLLTVLTVASIVLCHKFLPKLPSMLVGMLVGTFASVAFGFNVETIGARFGDLPRQLPLPALPSLSWAAIPDLINPALTIALLAAIESLLSATVADGMTGDRHRPDTELIGQGIGNFGAVFFGGIPATGAIARTATNIRCGARTPVAGIVHAVTLLLILLLFAPQAKLIPLAALSGILVVVCFNMSEYRTFLRMFKGPKSDSFVMVVTFVLTVMVDLVLAVEIGVVLAALLFIRRMSELSAVKEITEELKNGGGANAADDPEATSKKLIPDGVVVFEVQGPFFFGAVDRFRDMAFGILRRRRQMRIVVLRLRHVAAIDATGLNVLRGFQAECRRTGVALVLSGVQPQPRTALERSGLLELIGPENVCSHIDLALERVTEIINEIA